jgi:hypothetical protein
MAIVFGTAITINMSFTSLLSGLRLGVISCVLYEAQEFALPAAASKGTFKRLRTVDQWKFEIDDRSH